MKTTIDLDEAKLKRIMRLTGIKTRKKAIDFALREAERIARMNRLFGQSFYSSDKGDVVDPRYDVLKQREKEKPGHHARG